MGPPFPTAGILVILPELCAKLNASFQYLPEIKFAFKKRKKGSSLGGTLSCIKKHMKGRGIV
jgi:hypothetical protein